MSKSAAKIIDFLTGKEIKTKPTPKARQSQPKKKGIVKFEAGKTYIMNFITSSSLKEKVKVLKRTAKTATIIVGSDKKPIRKKIQVFNGVEKIYPDGKYSMAPYVTANNEA